MTDHQIQIVGVLSDSWGDKRSQTFLAKHTRVGSSRHEHPQVESTLRRVRQVIRELRVDHHIPICSDRNGYWLPTKSIEIERYLSELEREAKARARSSMVTYHSVKTATGIVNNYMEELAKLGSYQMDLFMEEEG